MNFGRIYWSYPTKTPILQNVNNYVWCLLPWEEHYREKNEGKKALNYTKLSVVDGSIPSFETYIPTYDSLSTSIFLKQPGHNPPYI